jgi:hypothetical protein
MCSASGRQCLDTHCCSDSATTVAQLVGNLETFHIHACAGTKHLMSASRVEAKSV